MKLVKYIRTAALALLLGTTASVYAQKGQGERGGGGQKEQRAQGGGGQKEQQAQHQQQPQHTQQAQHSQQPRRTQQAQRTQQQPQRVQRAEHTQHAQRQPQRVSYNRGNKGFHGNGNNGHHYGRIPDDRYRAHFGHAHSFRMNRPRMIGGYERFQYNGYWFGYNEPWPSDWYYTDDVYVEYVDNSYYLYDLRHPGIHITLNLF